MSLRDLESSLDPLRAIYLVFGDAEPLLRDAVHRIEKAVLPRVGLAAFNHSSYRATEPSAVQAFAGARTLPMMADFRLVVVRDAGEGDDTFFSALLDYAQEPSSSSVVVVTGSKFPKVEKGGTNWSTRIRNAVKKAGGAYISVKAADVDPARFAIERARQQGKELGQREAAMLLEIVGGDLGRLAQEIDKVSVYVGENPRIVSADLEAACSFLAEAVIWDLTTGLARGDAELALGSLHRLQEDGDDPRKLLGMITWQYRELLRVAELAKRGASDQEIRKQTRMRWDLFNKVRPIMGGPGRPSLFPTPARVLERLARAGMDMNSHRAGASRILEAMVLEILAGSFEKPRRASPRQR